MSVETTDFYMQTVKQPIMSLTSGVINMVTWQLCVKVLLIYLLAVFFTLFHVFLYPAVVFHLG